MDANDNELAYLEAIHLFVEVLGAITLIACSVIHVSYPSLDTFFDNVCELDLVFNFYKVQSNHHASSNRSFINDQVYAILDEVFLAGEIEETSKEVVLARLEELEKLE